MSGIPRIGAVSAHFSHYQHRRRRTATPPRLRPHEPGKARRARSGHRAHLLCTPSASDGSGGKTSRSGARIDEPLLGGQAREMSIARGKYSPLSVGGRALLGLPAPTEPNKNGNPRLSAAFSEWMMGWPAGWVTDPAIGISRNDQLRIVGNGVVPAAGDGGVAIPSTRQ